MLAVLDEEFFIRAKLPPNARRWKHASLATFLTFVKQRFTLKKSPTDAFVYGNAAEVTPRLCVWTRKIEGSRVGRFKQSGKRIHVSALAYLPYQASGCSTWTKYGR